MTAFAKLVETPAVQRLWPGGTFVCIAAGPSLTQEDVDYCLGNARVIAIKDAVRLAPWADVLYSGEIKWWQHYGPVLDYKGLRYGIDVKVPVHASVTMLRNTGTIGLETDPSGLRTGKNSGYQAVNLAVHLGAAKVVLLGYDMKPGADGQVHWFGRHPYAACVPPLQDFLAVWPSIVQPLKDLRVEVINATRDTALDVFPRLSLKQALA